MSRARCEHPRPGRIEELREALTALIGEFGVPRELAVTVAAA